MCEDKAAWFVCLSLGMEIPLTVGRGKEVYIPASSSRRTAELCFSPTPPLPTLPLGLSPPYLAKLTAMGYS